MLVVQTFERLFSCPAKLSSSSRRQLVQSLRQMDRVGGFGRPVHGQGFAWLVDQMNLEADYLPGELAEYERAASAEAVVRGFAREPDRPERPRSVGYFVVRLKRTARHWRRGWRARRNRKDDHP